MEKEMRPMTTEMLKKGYLLFPKALFEEQMNMKTGEKAADAFEAFVFDRPEVWIRIIRRSCINCFLICATVWDRHSLL